jgi:membrane protein DedA with SNARE-associated domain
MPVTEFFLHFMTLLPEGASLSAESTQAAVDPSQGALGSFIADYGPWAMIVLLLASGFGIPIGEEVVNIPAGIFVGQGRLSAVSAYLAAYFGVLGGDFIWFGICRVLGKSLLHRKWFKRLAHPKRLLQVKHKFDRRGAWVLVIARFIPGTRTPALTIAGMMHMSWRRFTLIELGLCAVTTALQVTVGILIGKQMAQESLQTTVFAALAAIAVILALTAVITWVVNRSRSKEPAPRERIAWLRRFGRKRNVINRQRASHSS